MTLLTTAVLAALGLSTSTEALEPGLPGLPAQAEQLVLVTADSWTTRLGTLRLFEKRSGAWQPTGAEWHVDIGKQGLGWGRGLLPGDRRRGPEKVEGDGRAPAGVFELREAFGYAELPPEGTRVPYRQATERDYWVDQVDSPQYNQWVRLPEDANQPERYWSSFELMRRRDNRYRLGLVVRHNMDPAVSGKGSAIFLHIWEHPGDGTSGCTSMTERDMLALLRWLDPEKYPIFVQLPRSELPSSLSP
jgi:L,D-peptidoglycan transpeptidase YkuD (ErfK/YbiS/YcfS/YnhG family)